MPQRRAAIRTSEALGMSPCACTTGGACTVFAPGHAAHLIQSRLVAATPAEWTDAVVERTDAVSGELVLRSLDGAATALWHRAAAREVAVGDPVSLHARYHLLALGRRRWNVALLG